ncbi:hypothetical protein BGZ58_001248 [Dissophora ornata]|nr:hypothetical protein BGZ58_001248 [Dissophora ornata]
MEYINSTTVTFVAAGASAGAYLVYANVIEPHNRAQRALQVEEAQRELLRLEEINLSSRGSNKQAKKRTITVGRPKKAEKEVADDDVTLYEDVNEKVMTSNSYDLLGDNSGAAIAAALTAPVARSANKEIKKSTVKKPAALIAIESDSTAIAEETTTNISETKRNKGQEAREEMQIAVQKEAEVQGQSHAKSGAAAAAPGFGAMAGVLHEQPHQQLQRDEKDNGQQQRGQTSNYPEKNPVGQEVVISSKEVKVLQASLQTKDQALIVAESHLTQARLKIQDLQCQIKANAELAKSAQRSRTRAEKFEAKSESLSYTNSLLVRQLCQENDQLKTVQIQVLEDIAELQIQQQRSDSHVVELEARLETMEKEQSHAADQVERLQGLSQELQQQQSHTEAERRADVATRELYEVRHQLSMLVSEKETRITTLEADISALEAELESCKLQAEQYTGTTSRVEDASNIRIEVEKQSLIEEIKLLRGQLSQESSMLLTRDGEIKGLQEELHAAREKTSILEDEHKILKSRHEEELSKLHKENKSLSANRDEYLATLLTKASEIDAINKELVATLSDLTTSRTQIETLTAQQEAAQTNHTDQLTERQTERDQLANELGSSRTQIASLTAIHEDLSKQIREMKERSVKDNDTTQQQYAALEKQIQELKQAVADKESSRQLVFTEKEDLTCRLNELDATHKSCHVHQSQLVLEKDELSAAIAVKTSEVESLVKEKNSLSSQLHKKIDAHAGLKRSMDDLESSNQILALAKQRVDAELEAPVEASQDRKTKIDEEYEAMPMKVIDLEKEAKVGDNVEDGQDNDILEFEEIIEIPFHIPVWKQGDQEAQAP